MSGKGLCSKGALGFSAPFLFCELRRAVYFNAIASLVVPNESLDPHARHVIRVKLQLDQGWHLYAVQFFKRGVQFLH